MTARAQYPNPARMADDQALQAQSHVLEHAQPLALDGGQALAGARVAYETYGTLNADKSNAVMIFHALTGDQCVASPHPITGKPGWWLRMVGPGKPIDTDRFFIICANVVPGHHDPRHGAGPGWHR